jgi:hypothetical protein
MDEMGRRVTFSFVSVPADQTNTKLSVVVKEISVGHGCTCASQCCFRQKHKGDANPPLHQPIGWSSTETPCHHVLVLLQE